MNSIDVDRRNMSHETTFADTPREFWAGDWDRDGWHFWDGTSEVKLTKSEFLDGKFFAENLSSTFYIDAPHLQERKTRRGGSKSQIYTRDELQILSSLAAQYEIKIKAFPANMDPRARDEAGVTKEDGGDIRAIYQFVVTHPEVGIKSWRLPGGQQEDLWEAWNEIREDMDERLNIARGCEYQTEDHTRASAILHANFRRLSPRIIECFQVKQVNGKTGARTDFHDGSVVGFYVAVFDANGELRINPQGKFIGVDTIWNIIQLHPYHFKKNAVARGGGIARSNIKWHLERNALQEKDIYDKDGVLKRKGNGRQPEKRREFSKAGRELIKVFRDSSQIDKTLHTEADRYHSDGDKRDADPDRADSAPMRRIASTPGIIPPMKDSLDYLQPSLFDEDNV